VALVNARLSERSARMSRRLGWLMRPALAQFCTVHTADEYSAQRLIGCGAVADRVAVGGNLKFDIPVQEAWSEEEVQALGKLQDRPLVLLASTHEGEEAEVLKHWPTVLAQFPQALLVIVPRHPHRFEHVAKLVEQSALRMVKRSSHQPIQSTDHIVLVDAMGELQQWYRLATVCAVAGSWMPIGGHNPLEALLVGKPVLFGPHTKNFETLYLEIEQAGAGERAASVDALMKRVVYWLGDDSLLATKSQAAQRWVHSHRGADQRAMAQLETFLPKHLASPVQIKDGNDTSWHNAALLGDLPEAWHRTSSSESATDPLRGGRGQVKLLQDKTSKFVLRHYHRGGLIGKILGDRFLRKKAFLSRSIQEFHLLSLMHAWQLPVPQAVAARHEAGVLFDRCDLLMVYVDNSMSLHAMLCDATLSQLVWADVGRMIARFHAQQVNHVDLNCHNILLQPTSQDDGIHVRPLLIDFDKCSLRAGDDWKQSNLDRLQRSLRKEKRLRPNLQWQEEHWQWLLDGYARLESFG
jgi:3-deoxy-D-manno-octulosonic-acid transferase